MRFRFDVLMVLSLRGGRLPERAPGQLWTHRGRIARKIHELVALYRQDPYLRHSISPLNELATKIDAELARPLSERGPLGPAHFDIGMPAWIPQPGRKRTQRGGDRTRDAQHTMFERALCVLLEGRLGMPPFQLVALALNAILGQKDNDQEEIRRRWYQHNSRK